MLVALLRIAFCCEAGRLWPPDQHRASNMGTGLPRPKGSPSQNEAPCVCDIHGRWSFGAGVGVGTATGFPEWQYYFTSESTS